MSLGGGCLVFGLGPWALGPWFGPESFSQRVKERKALTGSNPWIQSCGCSFTQCPRYPAASTLYPLP